MTTRRYLGVAIGTLALVVELSGCSGERPPASGKSAPQASVVTDPSRPETGSAERPSGAVRYLSLGDSLTQGLGVEDSATEAFPARLADKWRQAGCDVELLNMGIGGSTAGQVLSYEVPKIAEFQPTVITFQAGANDIVRSVSLEEYRHNVKAVLNAASASGAMVIVLPQNEWFRSPLGQDLSANQAARRVDFDAALIEEADAHGAKFVDLRPLYEQQADERLWGKDGFHPTQEAYEAWAVGLAEAVPAPCG